MAGLTSSSLFKPPLSCSKLSQSTHSPSLSFSESNLFGLRLSFPALSAAPSSKSDPFVHLSSSSSSSLRPVSTRYGGRSDDDDNQALDLSSIRSDSVRLIDEQQNMVGVVSRKTAIQMAEDVELDSVEGMSGLVSEVAEVVGRERSMIDECDTLMTSTSVMQVEEYSLISQLIQQRQG